MSFLFGMLNFYHLE